jgi:geranyl-CoA carboxylase alpha subunit
MMEATNMRPFKNILIANRGEIAVRIMRTAKALGYRTIAVYSEADAEAPHVAIADDAVQIGPAPVAQSYLDIERILEAAALSGAEAIHPGYGFLSENAAFARACADAGLVFIGPPVDAIDLMGNKAAAKRRMIAAGVPCVPGYEGEDQSDGRLQAEADEIGFPVMVKAAAGGGGRGMRLVREPGQLTDALATARSEALNAFGSDELILEKAVERPRHVEIQVFSDAHGNTVHLGERDCSVQRRHQKVIEEAPCPVMTPELRTRMGAAAVEAARDIDYLGAGTVEFLLDDGGDFYFLEMNTRLQVEHPVTEMITGLDLVALQIQVAEGRPLGLTQEDVCFTGHAIEARLYAEDEAQDFLPCTGRIERWVPPQGDGVRVDSGIRSGLEVTPYYDPMIAKIVAWGDTREIARHRLMQALNDTAIFGLTTNRRFLADMLGRDAFAAGAATTAFIGEEFDAGADMETNPALSAAIGAVLMFRCERESALEQSLGIPQGLLDWSSGASITTRYVFGSLDLVLRPFGRDRYEIRWGEEDCLEVEALAFDHETGEALLQVDGLRHRVQFFSSGRGQLELSLEGQISKFQNAIAFADAGEAAGGGENVLAPMHGQLVELFVNVGDRVEPGQRIAVLEAMKMQHGILAEINGTIRAVHCVPGSQSSAGELLIEIEMDEA